MVISDNTPKNIIRKSVSILSALGIMLSALSTFALSSDEIEASSTASAIAKAVEGETLPTVYLTTDDGAIVDSKTEYKSGRFRMALTDRFSEYENECTDDNGDAMQIRCRGNSSFETNEFRLGDAAKYSYRIKLDHKADLLGMGESRHWVLIANFYDITSMRNKLVYDLSGMLGMPYLESRWVIVYMNGEYRGLYSLVEKLRVDETSINITDWEERAELAAGAIGRAQGLSNADIDALADRMKSNLMWVANGKFEGYKLSDYIDTSSWDMMSGILIEYDARMDSDKEKFYTSHGMPIQIKSPEAVASNPKMLREVKNLLNKFEQAIYSPTFCTATGQHYSEFVDVDSMIDYHMIFELFKNFEFGCLSIYLYIEDGKIHFGPCWDFDLSSANRVALSGDTYAHDCWLDVAGRAEWWKKLCADPVYATKMANRWFETRPYVDEMLDSMQIYYAYIHKEADKSCKKIGLPKCWHDSKLKLGNFNEEYKLMSEWMYDRVTWLDTAFAAKNMSIDNSGMSRSDRLFLTLKSDDIKVAEESSAVGSAAADYIIEKGSGKLTLSIRTRHTSHRHAEIYINGKLLDRYECRAGKNAAIEIDTSLLDMTEGAINSLYVVMINEAGDYYFTDNVNVRVVNNVGEGNQLKIWNSPVAYVKGGESVTLPTIDIDLPNGYSCLGYTDGEKLYAPGDEYTPNGNTYLYVKLARDGLFPENEKVTPPSVDIPPETPIVDDTPSDSDISNKKSDGGLTTAIVAFVLTLIILGGVAYIMITLCKPKNKV